MIDKHLDLPEAASHVKFRPTSHNVYRAVKPQNNTRHSVQSHPRSPPLLM